MAKSRLETDKILELKKTCDRLIREGDFAKARKILQNTPFKDIPRTHLVDICALARRAQLWKTSLKALRDTVRPKVKMREPARPNERLEYALALQKLGVYAEAQKMFSEISADEEPRVHMGKAAACVRRWEYGAALEHLDAVLARKVLNEYETQVAQVNRLACLAELESADFEKVYNDLEKKVVAENLKLLLGNILEISSHYWIAKEEWANAEAALHKAKKLLSSEAGVYAVYVDKWLHILPALKSKSIAKIEDFRKRALESSDWETLRHLDLFQTKLDPNCRWSNVVYYGTPYASFRKRLEKIRPYEAECWLSRDEKAKIKVDPWFPEQWDGDIAHRLMVFLLQDLYRPMPVGEIFSAMYPDQFFDPETSENRVRQAIRRTREWMEEMKYPLVLKEESGRYSVRMSNDCMLLCRKVILQFGKPEFIFGRFAGSSPVELTAGEWADKLKLSAQQIQRMLQAGQDSHVISKSGKGRYTTYVLPALKQD